MIMLGVGARGRNIISVEPSRRGRSQVLYGVNGRVFARGEGQRESLRASVGSVVHSSVSVQGGEKKGEIDYEIAPEKGLRLRGEKVN